METLGAWLRLWTPPRDVVVPPVPWGKVALGAALLAVGIAAIVAFVLPALSETRAERAARERKEDAAVRAERAAKVRSEQRPRFGTVAMPPAGADAATRLNARLKLVDEVETAVTRDARARRLKVARTACVPYPEGSADPATSLGKRRGGYDCFAGVRDIVRGGGQDDAGAAGTLAYPYRAIVDFTTGRFAFCKIAPLPGERSVPDPRRVVALPAACRP